MKLGIVGMLPGDFRTHTDAHFEAITDLAFTGAGFHLPGDIAADIRPSDIQTGRARFDDHGVDLAQLAVTYRECLFDPDPGIRERVTGKILTTAEIAAAFGSPPMLIRPGSRNPAGAWTPHRDNHTPEAWSLLVDTLGPIVEGLERQGVTAVLETHLVSILRDPESCRRLVDTFDSPSLSLVMDYVNHFETLRQVYESRDRLDHIFDVVGTVSPVMHIKDISIGRGLVLHIEECIPGTGELDLAHAFRRFQTIYPTGYGLIEHLKPPQIPEALENTRQILSATTASP